MLRAPALLLFAWLLLVVLAPPPLAGADGPYVAVGQLRGTINPAAASYVDRALGRAEGDGAALFVLQLDTPGGLDSSMRQIVQRILASRVPVVVYVAPPGARAASAGVYITYSANLAAMAPNTNIGSATPVAMSESGEAKLSDEMRSKMTNDAVAYLKSLAATRGRNASWAEDAVRQAVNAPATEALELGVVNYVAADLPDLLRQLDGAQLPGAQGEGSLRPSTLPVQRLDMQPLEGLLHALADPTIAYLLLSVGTLALMVELYHPGAIFPGVTGALCLLLAFYGLGTLPVNLAGVLFIILGVALFALDVVMPTHGVLTVGGILSFLLGSAVLINAPDGAPYLAIAWQAIALVTLFFVLFFGFLLGTVVRIQSRRSVNGRDALLGQRAQVRSPLNPSGLVFAAGELWSATTNGEAIPAGEWVEVEAVDGLRLRVRRAAAIAAPAAETAEPAAGT
jgi:membrane-bound serine protease (ClpP class)